MTQEQGADIVEIRKNIEKAIAARMKITRAQFDALVSVYERWQATTNHEILPREGVEIVPDDEYRRGDWPGCDYIGCWVGKPTESTPHGSMYLGIEFDGYTHS